ncbi:MAG TPA: pyridoxal-phosphate dependent enzyme [Rhodobacterales bacterium]|nr:pyridoxal-phosphate dependent enzyme [Rhodobacterales bacterium]
MTGYLDNPFRGQGLPGKAPSDDHLPSTDAEAVGALLARCPVHHETPLIDAGALAEALGVAKVWIKDERGRMGLGSFKALGAAYAIAHDAAQVGGDPATALKNRVYLCASAGNHGLSVAAGARLFGARAVIYLAETVPDTFANRLRAKGAEVVVEGADYEASMVAAEQAAREHDWQLLSDSSWQGYTELPRRVMEGYSQLAAEAARQVPEAPTHVLLQAGVGGLAAAVAAYVRKAWGDGPTVIVVEPDAAPALFESIRARHLVTSQGPVSAMGRLDCKTPSMVALNGLARDADALVTISEAQAADGVVRLAEAGLATTPSGGAGLAALLSGVVNPGADARVLAILSEGPEDG